MEWTMTSERSFSESPMVRMASKNAEAEKSVTPAE
jgi:hypothetical protein